MMHHSVGRAPSTCMNHPFLKSRILLVKCVTISWFSQSHDYTDLSLVGLLDFKHGTALSQNTKE